MKKYLFKGWRGSNQKQFARLCDTYEEVRSLVIDFYTKRATATIAAGQWDSLHGFNGDLGLGKLLKDAIPAEHRAKLGYDSHFQVEVKYIGEPQIGVGEETKGQKDAFFRNEFHWWVKMRMLVRAKYETQEGEVKEPTKVPLLICTQVN